MAEGTFLDHYPVDENIDKMWKRYPVRIFGHSISHVVESPLFWCKA